MRRRLDIQGLRAVSVLVVALDHANVSVLAGGFIGVDVFFVLSGFLITSLLVAEAADSQGVSISGFYARRARRILPAATLTLVATAIASSLILNFVRAKEVFIDVISAGFFVSNFRFSHSTDYFAQSQPPSPVQQFWSLSVEEQFYVVWPLLLAALVGATIIGAKRAGKQQNLRWGRLLGGLTVVTLASFVWSVISTSADPAPAYFSTFTRIWELAFGALLAIALSGKVRAPVRMPRPSPALLGVAGWAGLAMIITAALTFSPSTVFPGYAALLPTLGAVLIIAAGSPAEGVKWGVWGLSGLRPLGYVGDRSYALYLLSLIHI